MLANDTARGQGGGASGGKALRVHGEGQGEGRGQGECIHAAGLKATLRRSATYCATAVLYDRPLLHDLPEVARGAGR